MKRYDVLVPIAGHILVTVDAASEDDAVKKAMESNDLTLDNIGDWEVLEKFNSGNVCYCPRPWDASATLAFGETEAEDA